MPIIGTKPIDARQPPDHMPRTLRLPFRLDAGLALVSIETFEGQHTVLSAVCQRTRRNLPVTLNDLDEIERSIEAPLSAEVEALDVMTGAPVRFAVEHLRGVVFAVRYAEGPGAGVSLRPGGPQFTETTEAFAIDRALAEIEAEADVRHMASHTAGR